MYTFARPTRASFRKDTLNRCRKAKAKSCSSDCACRRLLLFHFFSSTVRTSSSALQSAPTCSSPSSTLTHTDSYPLFGRHFRSVSACFSTTTHEHTLSHTHTHANRPTHVVASLHSSSAPEVNFLSLFSFDAFKLVFCLCISHVLRVTALSFDLILSACHLLFTVALFRCSCFRPFDEVGSSSDTSTDRLSLD